jgi:hypothetical protein
MITITNLLVVFIGIGSLITLNTIILIILIVKSKIEILQAIERLKENKNEGGKG